MYLYSKRYYSSTQWSAMANIRRTMKNFKSLTITACVVVCGSLIASAAAYANPCKSHFQKVSSALQRIGPPIVKLICTQVNKDDQAAIDKCNADYEKAVAKIDELTKTYNKDAGSEKIGPRGLGFNASYKGTLLAERVFISPPTANTEVTITLNVTGGAYTGDWKVHFCGIDENGQSVNYSSKSFKGKSPSSFKRTFTNMLGKRVQVYLSKKAGTKGIKYNLRATGKGLPAFTKTPSKKLKKFKKLKR